MKAIVCQQPQYPQPAPMIIPTLNKEIQQQQSLTTTTATQQTQQKIYQKKPEDFIYSLSTTQPEKDNQLQYIPQNFDNYTPEPLKMATSGKGETQVMLIRHGTTVFNLISNKFTEQTGYTFKDREALFTFDQLLMDTQLHQSGKDQAQKLGLQLKNSTVNVHTVFVSPMRRTLQTCYYTFKNHPQRQQIKFVVLPLVCEIYSKVCDIFDSRNTFQDEELKQFFDFSLINQTWQIENLQDQELKQQLKQRLVFNDNNKCENLEEILTEFSDDKFPKNVESYDSVYKRGQLTKSFIKNYIQQNKIDDKQQKVAIISHNSYLRNFTANGPDTGKNGAGGLKFANCQAMLYNF